MTLIAQTQNSYVGTINQKDISAVNTGWYKTIKVEGVKVNFQLDTARC